MSVDSLGTLLLSSALSQLHTLCVAQFLLTSPIICLRSAQKNLRTNTLFQRGCQFFYHWLYTVICNGLLCYQAQPGREDGERTMLHAVVPKVYWHLFVFMVRSSYPVDRKLVVGCVVWYKRLRDDIVGCKTITHGRRLLKKNQGLGFFFSIIKNILAL